MRHGTWQRTAASCMELLTPWPVMGLRETLDQVLLSRKPHCQQPISETMMVHICHPCVICV